MSSFIARITLVWAIALALPSATHAQPTPDVCDTPSTPAGCPLPFPNTTPELSSDGASAAAALLVGSALLLSSRRRSRA
jgi:hypothetical protein